MTTSAPASTKRRCACDDRPRVDRSTSCAVHSRPAGWSPSSSSAVDSPPSISVNGSTDPGGRHRGAGRTGDARRGHHRLRLGDGVLAEVEDAGGQHAGGAAVDDALDQVLQRADAAAGDHRHADRVGDRAGQLEVEALLGAVAVHRGQQDLAGAERRGLAPPTATASMPVGVRPPCRYTSKPRPSVRRLASIAHTTALRAELGGDLADQLGPLHGRGVDADLVGAGAQHASARRRPMRMPPPTVNGMKTCSAVRVHDVDHRVATVGRRGDVEEDQLVGALAVVARGQLDRIAGVAEVDEVDALHHAAVGDVEARDDASAPSSAPRVPCQTRIVGHREPTFVQRLAGDDPGDARHARQRGDVGQRRHAAAGDDGDVGGRCGGGQAVDVGAVRACRRGRCR